MTEALSVAEKYLSIHQIRDGYNGHQVCEESMHDRNEIVKCDNYNESLRSSLLTEHKIGIAASHQVIKADYRDLLLRSIRYGSYARNCDYMLEGLRFGLGALK